jgi:integrase
VDATPVSNLDPACVREFRSWMKKAKTRTDKNGKKTARYQPTTVIQYAISLIPALTYWQAQGWLAFEVHQPGKNVPRRELHTKRWKKDAQATSRDAERVPKDYGYRMLAAAMSLPIPPQGAPIYQKRRLWVLRTRAVVAILVSTGLPLGVVCRLTMINFRYACAHKGRLVIRNDRSKRETVVFLQKQAMEIVREFVDSRPEDSRYLLTTHRSILSPKCLPLTEFAARKSLHRIFQEAYGKEGKSVLPARLISKAFQYWYASQEKTKKKQ